MKHRRWLALRISAGYDCFVAFREITPDFQYQPLPTGRLFLGRYPSRPLELGDEPAHDVGIGRGSERHREFEMRRECPISRRQLRGDLVIDPDHGIGVE